MKTTGYNMNNSKTVAAFMFTTFLTMGFTSCNNDDDVTETESDKLAIITNFENKAEFTPEVLYQSKVFIANGVDNHLKEALRHGAKDVNGDINDSQTKIIVLSKLSDLNDQQLETAYREGKSIAIANPDPEVIKQYANSHPWAGIVSENIKNDLMLFAFNRDRMFSHISKPVDLKQTSDNANACSEATATPTQTDAEAVKAAYVFISGWLSEMQQHYNEQAPALSRGEGKDSKSLEDFANHYHTSFTYPYSVNYNFRNILWSDDDYLSGSASMTVAYDIYMCHVYEGQSGAGDYYAVNMSTSVANANMWKGTGDNRHGGVHVRWCGWYGTGFTAKSMLCPAELADKNITPVSVPNVQFTAQGTPSPQTTVGTTVYTSSHSFNIGTSLTIGGKIGIDSNGPSADANCSIGVSAGWTWTDSKQRDIKDTDIQNTSEGNVPSWRVNFNNLPEYSHALCFETGNAKAYRSTVELSSSWLWYDPTGKDNDDKEPYTIYTAIGADYEMQSFISTKADLKADHWSAKTTHKMKLPKMVNTTVGGIELNNDMDNGMYITNMQVKDADNGTVYATFKNSIGKDTKQALGFFPTDKKYIVTFDARKAGSAQVKHYTYALNKYVTLTKTSTIKLNANFDFTETK